MKKKPSQIDMAPLLLVQGPLFDFGLSFLTGIAAQHDRSQGIDDPFPRQREVKRAALQYTKLVWQVATLYLRKRVNTMVGKVTLCFAILLGVLSDRGLCSSSLREFYVKPTGSRAECPSPCRSLQDYANNSSFTTNKSKFIFLEGEHHLGTVVDIRNVANLSMVGVSPRVKILCVSLPSGFYNLLLENSPG